MKISKSVLIVASIVIVLIAGVAAGTYYLIKPLYEKDKEPVAATGTQELSDKQAKKVVAEVNGTKILYKEFYELYNQQKAYAGITDENPEDPKQQEMIKSVKDQALNQIIERELAIQKAQEAGYVVTDEVIAETKKEFDDMMVDISEQMKQNDTSGETGKDYVKEAQDYVDGELKAIGKTKDEYIEEMAQYKLVGKFMEELAKDVGASDADIKSYYDDQLKAQKEGPAGYGAIQLIQPSETRVKHVLIALPKEEQDEYNKLASEGKTDEAKKYLEEKLAVIKPKAQEVLDKAKSGSDFEALIDEYGEDPGMKSEQYKDGYVVTADSQLIPEFKEASMKLEDGEISDLVAGAYGYHIIKAYEKKVEKAFALEEKKEEIKALLDNEKKATFMEDKMEEWKTASTINKYEKEL